MVKTLKLSPRVWGVGLAALALIAGSVQGGSLEPPGPPGPTMKTLDEIPPTWSQVLPASERFVLVMGGVAVLDKETGLVWQRHPWDHPGITDNWSEASRGCSALLLGGRMGWRLPAVEEMMSLVDYTTGEAGQYLPSGHPFTQINTTAGYWTSTAAVAGMREVVFGGIYIGTGCVGCVGFREFFMRTVDEATIHLTWCVRGGRGVGAQ